MTGRLSELVKARIDEELKRELVSECERTQRSEGAVVRLALRAYLSKRKGK